MLSMGPAVMEVCGGGVGGGGGGGGRRRSNRLHV